MRLPEATTYENWDEQNADLNHGEGVWLWGRKAT